MKLQVNSARRQALMRAHTATHLLHAQLQTIFPTTQQAWSLVDDDILRFDFQAPRALTADEIHQINDQINQLIAQSHIVTIQEMAYPDAIKLWAKAFFEDKYGDVVRVVQVIDQQTQSPNYLSIELCGGTHVSHTNEIWCFTIIGQESVASGIRRISAVTGPRVYQLIHEQSQTLWQLWVLLDCTPKQLTEKAEKLTREMTQLQTHYTKLQHAQLKTSLHNLPTKLYQGYTLINIDQDESLAQANFKDLVHLIREIWQDQELIVQSKSGNFAIISPSSQAKQFAQSHQLKGWGNDNLVQGKDTNILNIS